jgi:glycosyltransferase involved in cell wall biosynthesis
MKKKMLYLSTYDPTLPGTGCGVRGIIFVDFLAKRYDLHLLFMEGFGHSPERTPIALAPRIPKEILSVTKIRYTDFEYFIFSRILYKEAKKLLEKEKFDLIFADFEKSGMYAYLLSRKYKIPFIYNSLNVEYLRYLEFARKDWRRYLFIPYVYFMEMLGCRGASLVATITEEDAHVFSRWISKDKLIVLPGGFDEKIYHPYYEKPPEAPPIILFIGNFNNPGNKEAVYLIKDKIIEEVASKHPEVIFQFVGANPPQDISHAHIKFTGFVEDILPYLRRANLVIVPVLKGGGMRIKTIEALASGKYVISTSKGAEGIHQKLSSLYVCSIEEFPQAISQALNKKKFIFPENYEKIKKEYSSQNILECLDSKIVQLFKEK